MHGYVNHFRLSSCYFKNFILPYLVFFSVSFYDKHCEIVDNYPSQTKNKTNNFHHIVSLFKNFVKS